ncbi:hypothetical protein CFC21_057987 [Triticum aestivum]|uniref:Uncharacterized protein n=3 Tax=Triticum TaxID=4564 RepID=A0A9R0T5N9_TRITD|nr:hypothetical protein CFC21_057987 [Triticum aestivum]VAI06939.1 unnamed protein product [Triticum turgidum subsp. durum]
MASLALVPSWFRRRAHVPSPEEAREIARRKRKEEYDQLIASLRPRPSTWRSRRRERREALANEAAKREWIDEQKRLIAEAKQRSGGVPHPCWNDDARDRRRMRAAVEELSAAFEAKKSQWMAAHKRSGLEEARRSSTAVKVRPLVSTEAPLKPVTAAGKSSAAGGSESGRRVEMHEAKAMEQNHLWGRRRSDEYYAMRREVLRRDRAALDEITEPQSACATRKGEDRLGIIEWPIPCTIKQPNFDVHISTKST